MSVLYKATRVVKRPCACPERNLIRDGGSSRLHKGSPESSQQSVEQEDCAVQLNHVVSQRQDEAIAIIL